MRFGRGCFETPLWKQLIDNVVSNASTFHLIGLLSDGNVHSHIHHLKAMLDELSRQNIETVRLHILLDGRDVPGRSALTYVAQLEDWLRAINNASNRDYRIASGEGVW